MPIRSDRIDRAIPRTLQRDGRIRNVELADRVGLSPSPCLRRVRPLEEAGVIERHVALPDPAKVGTGPTVFARVCLTGQDKDTAVPFVEAIGELPQVVECRPMAGDSDVLLRVVAADLDADRRFRIEHLGRIEGVRNIKAEIPMQKIKHSWEIPV